MRLVVGNNSEINDKPWKPHCKSYRERLTQLKRKLTIETYRPSHPLEKETNFWPAEIEDSFILELNFE